MIIIINKEEQEKGAFQKDEKDSRISRFDCIIHAGVGRMRRLEQREIGQ
jgi:hypothetical protein